jgi:hypothetical protein
MNLDQVLTACALVEVIDILGNHTAQNSHLFEFDKSMMAGIGVGGTERRPDFFGRSFG